MENLNLKLKDINDKKLEIRSKLETEENLDLDSVKAELDSLEKEEKEIRSKLSTSLETKELKDIKEEKKLEVKRMENKLESLEYREAFKRFVQTGEMAEEFRAVSMSANNQAVIPTPILNTIVEKLENYGNVIPLVTKVNYPAGFSIPVSQLAGPATWTDEVTLSTTGVPVGAKTTSPITFSAYALQKALGISFFAQIQTLSAFESKVAENVATAMGMAIEDAIVRGDGNGKPTGIFTEAATAPDITLNATLKYKDLVNMKKAIPAFVVGLVVSAASIVLGALCLAKNSNGDTIITQGAQLIIFGVILIVYAAYLVLATFVPTVEVVVVKTVGHGEEEKKVDVVDASAKEDEKKEN